MTNPVRTCLACGKKDDHPKHQDDRGSGVVVYLHMDCCALSQECAICIAQLEGVGGVGGNPKGERLRKHLLTTGPEADKPGWTAPTVRG